MVALLPVVNGQPRVGRRHRARPASLRLPGHRARLTNVRHGIRSNWAGAAPGMRPVWPLQIRSRRPENRIRKPTLTVRPDYRREPRRPANTGEDPRKRWASRDCIRSCSRLFVGLETANGPQRTPRGTAIGPQPPSRVDARQSRLWARVPRLSWCAGRGMP
jgi:hypothetical protein